MPANNDRLEFESAIQALQAEIANAGAHLVIDSTVRHAYTQQVAAMSHDLRFQVHRGMLTWKQAAAQAQETRNVIMEIMRSRSTPVGRAIAEQIKSKGKTLNELIARKTIEKFEKTQISTTLLLHNKTQFMQKSSNPQAKTIRVFRKVWVGSHVPVEDWCFYQSQFQPIQLPRPMTRSMPQNVNLR